MYPSAGVNLRSFPFKASEIKCKIKYLMCVTDAQHAEESPEGCAVNTHKAPAHVCQQKGRKAA